MLGRATIKVYGCRKIDGDDKRSRCHLTPTSDPRLFVSAWLVQATAGQSEGVPVSQLLTYWRESVSSSGLRVTSMVVW